MSQIGEGTPHDDRAWRRGALPGSIAVAGIGAGISIVVAIHEQRAFVAIVPVIAAIVGAWLMVIIDDGRPVPPPVAEATGGGVSYRLAQ
ncbi:hypothetical protein [Rhizocola hellebori]|uniref:hypothetical protein n=1 Tax=Rhizocola hellebori TaxID=1392758 RepID=UPI0019433DE6|nr:hypothetical protein [Rhizocola hellebori]